MKDTAIEWADNTINFFVGCTKVSEGCENCYMYRLEKRWGRDPTIVRMTNWATIEKNLKTWKPSRIFVNSMSDTFHIDIEHREVVEMFKMMEKYSQHTYIVLTKRIGRAAMFFKLNEVPDNVWIGTSIESEKHYMRANILKGIQAKVKFISFEPLLSNVSRVDLTGIQWVIVGGESGSNSRKMHEADVDAIFSQAQAKGIPFFFKQWGKGLSKCKCHNAFGCRVYKGKTWDEVPKIESIISH